jgi:hypothetical protein
MGVEGIFDRYAVLLCKGGYDSGRKGRREGDAIRTYDILST